MDIFFFNSLSSGCAYLMPFLFLVYIDGFENQPFSFIATPSKTQAPTNITTLETEFGTRFKCRVCGLTGLQPMTFSDEQ